MNKIKLFTIFMIFVSLDLSASTLTNLVGPLPAEMLVENIPIKGYIDFHTHPMSYLAFGGKALHGAPDIGVIIPTNMYGCEKEFTGNWEGYSLGGCSGNHGPWSTDNGCGDVIRSLFISLGIDEHFKLGSNNLQFDHGHPGYPYFQFWPSQTSVLHQQMWWEWIERAHQGGLNVMVALTTNSETIARVLDGNAPIYDKEAADRQIDQMVKMVKNHDFMEIARTSSDVVRIVNNGKLAIILGMEIDFIGNLGRRSKATPAAMQKEIRRLYDKGIRYIFPIHLVDNALGGAAVYSALFNLANKDLNGYFFRVEHNSGTTYDTNSESQEFKAYANSVDRVGNSPSARFFLDLLEGKKYFSDYINIPPGHANALGLTPLGEFAIKEMMKYGMLIDLDHMSEKAMTRTIEIAEDVPGGYPLIFGHGGIRPSAHSSQSVTSERAPPLQLAQRVAALGGMFGIGTDDVSPSNFVLYYRTINNVMGSGNVGLGTDVNGFVRLPRNSLEECSPQPSQVGSWWKNNFYSYFFRESKIRTKSRLAGRVWDYTEDCVAHYGLMPEFIYDVRKFHRAEDVYQDLMQSAGHFVQMWARAESAQIILNE